VRGYIEAQEAHHRAVGFQDEFRRFLDRLGMVYDPELLWR
jgi:hypothetical protein